MFPYWNSKAYSLSICFCIWLSYVYSLFLNSGTKTTLYVVRNDHWNSCEINGAFFFLYSFCFQFLAGNRNVDSKELSISILFNNMIRRARVFYYEQKTTDQTTNAWAHAVTVCCRVTSTRLRNRKSGYYYYYFHISAFIYLILNDLWKLWTFSKILPYCVMRNTNSIFMRNVKISMVSKADEYKRNL